MKNKLAIAIPTYNRPDILKFNLLQIIDELIQYNISVYISDDSTNSETELMIANLKNKHSLFFYKKNKIGLGHDRNCISTILMVEEEYVWYLGDSMVLKKGAIKKILEVIGSGVYDFICCNAEGRNLDIKDKIFDKEIEVFEQLCWHLTMTGATVYNKKNIISLRDFDVSLFKNFPQTAIIFEQFATKKSKLYWLNEKLIYGNPNKNSYWASKVFEVFLNDYKRFVFNLNKVYTSKSKDIVISKHSINSGIFNYSSFLKYRNDGFFNYKVFCLYKVDIKKYSNANGFVLFLITQLPRPFLNFLRIFFKYKF